MELLLDGFHHRGMAMSGHQGAEAEVMVHVFVAVEVMNPAGFSVLHKNGIGLVVPVILATPSGIRCRARLCATADFGVRFS